MTSRASIRTLAAGGLAVIALAAATGLAFAGWMEHGAGMFLALAENGMSWCF